MEPKASKNSTLSADPQASSKPLRAWAQRLDATVWFQAPKVTGLEEKQRDPSDPPSWGRTCPHTLSRTLAHSPGPSPVQRAHLPPLGPPPAAATRPSSRHPLTRRRGEKGWSLWATALGSPPGKRLSPSRLEREFPKPALEASWETLTPQPCTLCLSWSLPRHRLRWILSSLFWKAIYLLAGFPNIMSPQVAQDGLTNKRLIPGGKSAPPPLWEGPPSHHPGPAVCSEGEKKCARK